MKYLMSHIPSRDNQHHLHKFMISVFFVYHPPHPLPPPPQLLGTYGHGKMYCPASQEWQWRHVLSTKLLGTYNHVCINPIHRIGLIHKWSIHLRQLKWSVHVSVLFRNCKQCIKSLSLLAGTTVPWLSLIQQTAEARDRTSTASLQPCGLSTKYNTRVPTKIRK